VSSPARDPAFLSGGSGSARAIRPDVGVSAGVVVLAGRTLVGEALAALLREEGLAARYGMPAAGEAPPDRPLAVALLLDDLGHELAPTIAALHVALPLVRTVVLVAAADAPAVSRADELGVHGLVDGHASGRDLAAAIRQVAAGRRVFPASVLLDEPAAAVALSRRQRDVLRLVAQGLSNQEIAQELTITVNTVKFHVRTIFRELGIHNRVEAARLWAADDVRGHLFG
jgi:DNA-binding NarL/FixJ family response regulator